MSRSPLNFEELTVLICSADAQRLLELTAVLTAAIEELRPMVGFSQRSPHHAYDLYTHTAHVTAATPADPVLRWAALLHDTGKVDTFTLDENGRGHFWGHAQVSAGKADAILRRLGAPEKLRQQAVALIENHMLLLEEKGALEAQLHRLGSGALWKLIALQEADHASKGTPDSRNTEQFSRIRCKLALLIQKYDSPEVSL